MVHISNQEFVMEQRQSSSNSGTGCRCADFIFPLHLKREVSSGEGPRGFMVKVFVSERPSAGHCMIRPNPLCENGGDFLSTHVGSPQESG